MRWVEIDQSKLKDITVQQINVEGKQMVLIKFKDEFFATAYKCPHAGADISQGWCNDEGNLVCPFHRYEYHLKNGRGKAGQGDYLKTYSVKLENGKLFIGFKDSWLKKLFY